MRRKNAPIWTFFTLLILAVFLIFVVYPLLLILYKSVINPADNSLTLENFTRFFTRKYYVNTLTEGDYLYLVEGGTVYQYLWECTEVIAPDDWGPIYNRGYACVTLTTCTPIGVADHRLVVRGALVNALPLAEGYSYPSNTSEEG